MRVHVCVCKSRHEYIAYEPYFYTQNITSSAMVHHCSSQSTLSGITIMQAHNYHVNILVLEMGRSIAKHFITSSHP